MSGGKSNLPASVAARLLQRAKQTAHGDDSATDDRCAATADRHFARGVEMEALTP